MALGLATETPRLIFSSALLLSGLLLEAQWSPLAPSLMLACPLLAAAALILLVVSRGPAAKAWPRQHLRHAGAGGQAAVPGKVAAPAPAAPAAPQQLRHQTQLAPPETAAHSLYSWLGCCCFSGREADAYLEPVATDTREQRSSAARSHRGAMSSPLHPELQLVRPDERGAIDELVGELSPELQSVPPWEDLRGERCLLRFYRGHGSVASAARAYREMLSWRSKHGANSFREAVSELPWVLSSIPGMDRICRALPIDINAGRTAKGHLIWIERSGSLKVKDFTAIPDSEFQGTWGRLMELRTKHLDELSKLDDRLVKVVQIRDLRGFSASLYMSLVACGALRRLQSIILGSMSAHPESIDQVVMLNAPRAFNSLWALIEPVLNDRMRRKFRFLPHPHDPREVFDVGGASALLSLSSLAAPDLPCPGSGATAVAAGDFLDLAVRVPAGCAVRWQWSGDLEFSAISFAESPATAEPLMLQSPVRLASASGSHVPNCSSVVLLRWSNTLPWSMATELSYCICLSDA
mmetsp:Transcript_108174/g.316313  ORF Transcript_108174/g.316313 Transcript_108174/m.316313 type:complete len:523 (-) Transcript_108174:238-1806(-)